MNQIKTHIPYDRYRGDLFQQTSLDTVKEPDISDDRWNLEWFGFMKDQRTL